MFVFNNSTITVNLFFHFFMPPMLGKSNKNDSIPPSHKGGCAIIDDIPQPKAASGR